MKVKVKYVQGDIYIINNNNNNNLYLSTPFIILQIHKDASRVIFTNFLNAHPIWHDLIHTLLGAKSLLSVIVG